MIAKDTRAFEWVRLSAARNAGRLGATSEAVSALASFVDEDHPLTGIVGEALDEMGELRAGSSLVSFARKPSTPPSLRLQVVEILDKNAMLHELKTISDDISFDPETRHRALVGLLGKSAASEGQAIIRRLLVDTEAKRFRDSRYHRHPETDGKLGCPVIYLDLSWSVFR